MKKNYLSFILLICALNFGFGQTYNQITSLAELTDGNYLIVGDGTTNDGLMTNSTAGSVYIDYDAITNPGATINSGFTANNIFNITVSGGNITIYNSSVGYASWGRSGVTGNDADFYNGVIANTERWTPSVSGGLWTLANVSDNTRVLQWNNSSPRFVAYTSPQVKLKLYKEVSATNTTVQFDTPTSTLTEDGVFIDVCVSITNPSTTVATTVDISLGGGSTATNGTDYDDGAGTPAAITFPQTLTFPANTNADQCLTIYISNDDTLIEADETVVLNLTSPSGGDSASIGSTATHTLTILDNDFYDTCATSVTIPVNATCVNQSFTNVGATDSGVADPGCGSYSGGDVWFNLTVPASGSVTVETSDNGGITDSGLALYSGTCGSLSLIDCDDDSGTGNMSLINATGLTPGSTIYVRVWEFNNNDFDTFNICAYSAPEIDVERNTGTSIPNGSAANAGYNTVFAATVIGSSSAPKTFHVSSEGSADVNLTSITSSNPTEFSVSLNPSPATVTPGTEVDFEITFSPNGVGLRTATITIVSNDADENPYTFNVQGNGECAAGTLTFLPDNGPVNTIVNVTTSSTNFGGSTTATVNGIPATVNVISNSEIEVTIPSGATTGSLEIIDDLGCVSSDLFTVIDQQISSCEGSSGTTPLDLFISEITDHGTGSHSYVEIFNGTGATVDLTDYEIRIHNNGAATATSTIPLTGSVLNNDVFVLAFGSTNATDFHAIHGYDQSDNASGINEDDNIRLYYTPTNDWIDVWGDTSGSIFTLASKDYTYRRKNSGITAPNTYGDTTWNPTDWDAFTPVDYSDIGTYDFSTGTPPTVNNISSATTACNEVTISVSATEGYVTGNPLAYYWYAYDPANAGLGWQAISNGGIYTTNTTSPNLVISDPNSVLDFQFYCQVREDDATCFTASNAIKITYGTATWDGTNWTWNDGTAIDTMPTTNASVIIDGDYDTSSGGVQTSFEACDCTVNTDNTLTIENNTYVLVENDLTVDGNVIVKTDGSFVQVNDNANVDGAVLSDKTRISVEKETAYLASYHEYTYWGSPVNGEIVSDGLEEANDNRIYYFSGQNFRDSTAETSNNNATVAGQDDIDDDANDWQFANGATVMLPGVGYASTHDPSTFINPTSYSYTFEGAFNNGIFNVPIYRNDAETNDNNWNFIGNPYPSAIDADLFLAANSSIDQTVGATNGAIFFWSHNTAADGNTNGNENLNYAQSDYAIINGSGETMGGDMVMPNRYIPSGQGFFVSMDDGATASVHSGTIMTTNVVFNNSMRVTGNNDQFFRTAQYNKLWLNLTSDNGVFNQVLVAYVDGATDGDDGMYYDAHKNLSSDLYSGIYTIIDSTIDKKFAIQGKDPYNLNIDEVIPLGFITTIEEATIYTISIHATEGNFMGENDIFVIDYDLNIIHNLKTSDYNFTSNSGEFNNRFEIVFTPQALSINDNVITANDLIITELNNGEVQIKVSEQYTIQHVEILDVLGRQVYSLTGNSSVEVYNLSKLSNTAYIAKVTLSNGQVISKKAIKQR